MAMKSMKVKVGDTVLIAHANDKGRRFFPDAPIFVKVTRFSEIQDGRFFADPMDPSIKALNPDGYWFTNDEIIVMPQHKRTKGKYIGERVMQL